MKRRMVHIRVQHLNNGNRQIANDEANKDDQHHLRDPHLAPFRASPYPAVLLKVLLRVPHDHVDLRVAYHDNYARNSESGSKKNAF